MSQIAVQSLPLPQLTPERFFDLTQSSLLPPKRSIHNHCDPNRLDFTNSPLASELLLRLNSAFLNVASIKQLWDTKVGDAESSGGFVPIQAARCLEDFIRTHHFISAVNMAVRFERSLYPDRTLHCVDAGSGPFCLLALAAAMSDPNTKITCIETSKKSAELSSLLVTHLGLENQIEIKRCDALTYVAEQPLDLIMTETFASGLFDELGTQICAHLSKYRAINGLTIPEHVLVKLGTSTEKRPQPLTHHYGPAVFHTWEQVKFHSSQKFNLSFRKGPLVKDEVELELDLATLPLGKQHLFIASDFELMGWRLSGYDSALSAPVQIATLDCQQHLTGKLKVSYNFADERSQIQFSLEDSSDAEFFIVHAGLFNQLITLRKKRQDS